LGEQSQAPGAALPGTVTSLVLGTLSAGVQGRAVDSAGPGVREFLCPVILRCDLPPRQGCVPGMGMVISWPDLPGCAHRPKLRHRHDLHKRSPS
jgi:hypothetical protein